MLALRELPDPPFDEATSIADARRQARRLAVSDLPIVIEGEPGTGRRTLAMNLVHQRSSQSGCPTALLDAAEGISRDVRDAIGASDATRVELFLHNIESLSQRHLAEVGNLIHAKAIRLVCVMRHRDPEERTETDAPSDSDALEVHLGVTRIRVPPVRDRGDDVLRWARFFLVRAADRLSVPVPELSAGALEAIRRHRWPGNLIELEAVLSRALCLTATSSLQPSDLGLADGQASIEPLAEAVEHFRRTYIDHALAHFSGNRTQTARALGVDVRTIFRYLGRK